LSITKIYSRKVERTVNFATVDNLIEELAIFEKQMGWSLREVLKILEEKKADSISITKEKPFHYFYARLSENTIIIRLQTSEEENEFRLPIATFKRKT